MTIASGFPLLRYNEANILYNIVSIIYYGDEPHFDHEDDTLAGSGCPYLGVGGLSLKQFL